MLGHHQALRRIRDRRTELRTRSPRGKHLHERRTRDAARVTRRLRGTPTRRSAGHAVSTHATQTPPLRQVAGTGRILQNGQGIPLRPRRLLPDEQEDALYMSMNREWFQEEKDGLLVHLAVSGRKRGQVLTQWVVPLSLIHI